MKFKEYLIASSYEIKDEKAVDSFINMMKGPRGGLVIGNTGTGKTSLFQGAQKFLPLNHPKNFLILPCLELAHDFNITGFEVFDTIKKDRNYLIDDIGTEGTCKHYGRECNVVQELVHLRYDLFKSKKIKTYWTTNLNKEQMRAKYGDRACSRIYEMSDIIEFTGPDLRINRKDILWYDMKHKPYISQEDKEFYARYDAMTERRRNMTPEQIEAENKEGKRQFRFGDNEAFRQYKQQFFSSEEVEENLTQSQE